MANAAEQLRALLTQQRNVLTQLQPSQNELFGLVAKLRDLSLEASHGEITSYFEVAKKRYDFLEHKVSCALTFYIKV
jgi:hypothetical protein